jgi:FixJ family two-component response regulator
MKSLPLRPPTNSLTQAATSKLKAGSREARHRIRHTVFVIDDAWVPRAVRRSLRSAGLNVETLATAEEFLQSTEQPAPRCLVLDVHLPGLSGLELQERLNGEDRGVPVLFITAYAEEQTREQALRAGAVAFLQKPFNDQSLLDAVARALSL